MIKARSPMQVPGRSDIQLAIDHLCDARDALTGHNPDAVLEALTDRSPASIDSTPAPPAVPAAAPMPVPVPAPVRGASERATAPSYATPSVSPDKRRVPTVWRRRCDPPDVPVNEAEAMAQYRVAVATRDKMLILAAAEVVANFRREATNNLT